MEWKSSSEEIIVKKILLILMRLRAARSTEKYNHQKKEVYSLVFSSVINNMYKLLLCICIFSLISQEIYAAPPIYRPGLVEIEAAAKPCLPGGSGIPINDKYTCPIGDFSEGSSLSLSEERIKCSIQIALSLESIDKKAGLWTKQLQSSREKDVNKWIEDIRLKTKDAPESFANQYAEVCSITGWTISEDGKWLGCAKTTDFFPETACKDIIGKKVIALQNMGYILSSKGIAKSFQNDKDVHLDKVKSAYDLLRDKWNSYTRMVGNAVSKFTAYIRGAVK
jgi:hypothetical protein